ncbi:MAG TPA: PP2C family protein-serine/threonine phosphatase [Bacteroidia bacterium]|jgi:sigma-B regulation protein RsbU (phosphoserine phosphatase)|nr:PP2C family protein-serine/threonine phosphatase [Bacteroidia bacterium]
MATPRESREAASRTPRIKDLKLKALLEVTKAINSNQSTAELLTIFENIIRKELNIGKLVLFSHDGNSWKCLLSFGVDSETTNIDVDKEFKGIREITTIDIDHPASSLRKSFEIVIPVFHKALPLAYVLIGDLNEDEGGMSASIKHLPFVQTLTNIIVVAIENKKLAKENLKRAAMHRELELAWEVQRMLFPDHLPHNDNLDMDAVYLPHQQVGGDYYDFVQINENEVAICVADVSGKGVPAALLMSNFQANLRILLHHTPNLPDLVRELNTKISHSARGEKFITLFIAKYNMVTRVLHYINAGHNPPLVIDEDGANLLTVGCTGLGMFDEIAKVREGIVNVAHGALLLCYTDGLVETTNEKEEDFGLKRVQQIVLDNRKLSPKALNGLIIEKLNKFKGDQAYIDDIALVACRLL